MQADKDMSRRVIGYGAEQSERAWARIHIYDECQGETAIVILLQKTKMAYTEDGDQLRLKCLV